MSVSRVSYRNHMGRCLLGVACLAGLPAIGHSAEWPSTLNLATLDGSTGFRLDGQIVDRRAGHDVSGAGDVNGDGFADLIVGAYRAYSNGVNSGASYVVFGRSGPFASVINHSTLNGTTGFQLNGGASGDNAGTSVSGTGDINGDGLADLLIGAYSTDVNGTLSGSNFVVFGTTAGTSVIQLSALDGSNGLRIDGEAAGHRSGTASSVIGDINGDGFAEFVVGSYGAGAGGSFAGSSYLVFGRPAGFTSNVALSSLNGSTGFRFDGEYGGDRVGRAMSPAGDINGDGLDDLILGATGADTDDQFFSAGAGYVVYGKSGAFVSAFGPTALDGVTGFRLLGVASGERSGFSVSSAGDVNGDGFADVIIGSYNNVNYNSHPGKSYVVFGKTQSFGSALYLSSLDGSTGFRLDGVANGDNSGISAAAAGDVNGDGFGDVIIGASGADNNGAGSGSSYVVFGKPGGFSSTIALSSLDGVTGFRLDGAATSDRSGYAVSEAGDFNGDGFSDVIVGAELANIGATADVGSSYVVFGRPPTEAVSRIGSTAAQRILGGALADTLTASGAGDTLEGLGGGDSLNGDTLTTASYAHAPAGVTANLAAPSANTGHAAGDTYVAIRNLEGSAFNDVLTGTSGANRITGGKGKDTIKGGKGKDVIAYRLSVESRPTARDVIIGFNPGSASTAIDKIDLSAMDARTSVGGNQAFTFRGTKSFSGPGQVRMKKSGKDVVIQGNTGGSNAPEFEIVLKGLAGKIGAITKKDFNL